MAIVNALTSYRLEIANKATEARDLLASIRPRPCLTQEEKVNLDDIDDMLCGIINRAMRVE